MLAIRRWGLSIIAFVAITIFFLLEPDAPEESSTNLGPTNYEQLVDIAMSDYQANDALADSAPQQQVVNGWVARDLLQIQTLAIADLLDAVSEENSAGELVTAVDPRTPALIGLAILAICLIGVTTEPSVRDVEPVSVAASGDGGHRPLPTTEPPQVGQN